MEKTRLSDEEISAHLKRKLPPLDQCVLAVIDAQRGYCDPSYKIADEVRGTALTDSICRKMAVQVPRFRQAGLQVAWIFALEEMVWSNPWRHSFGGFHHVQPDKSRDKFFGKYADSAFHATGLVSHFMVASGYAPPKTGFHRYLERKQKATILLSGFNLSACVRRSARDAIRCGFDVIMLEDLCANDAANPSQQAGWRHFRDKMQHYRVKAPEAEREKYGTCRYTSSSFLLGVDAPQAHSAPQAVIR